MGLSEFYGETNDKSSLSLLHKVLENGINFIDTADMYGQGHTELLIGQFLNQLDKKQKEQLIIATKCGIERNENSYERRINNSADYIKKCCHESLKRLGIEQINLFYIHRISLETPIEETMQTLSELIKEGKIAQIGLCEVSAELLNRAHSTFPVDVIQTEYSLWTRNIEDELFPLLKKLNIGLVSYSLLGRGFLTGKYQSTQDFAEGGFRRTNPRFSDENIKQNKKLLDLIEPMTMKYHCTKGQIALSWLLAQSENIVPIPGTKKGSYLHENVQSCFIHLDEKDLKILNHSKNSIKIHGERYSTEGMKGIY